MLIDTHCHLDASCFDTDREEVVQRARSADVKTIIIPAIATNNFSTVKDIAHRYKGCVYALGIHPLCVPSSLPQDLITLEETIQAVLDDSRFVALGEIGLDYFVDELKTPAMQEKQEFFYQSQLALAKKYHLPVLLHVRRAQDRILKYLRQQQGVTGFAHAFNGSRQQAQQFIDLGFKLGAGGAMTFSRARQIHRLAADISLEHWVLETDAPDIPPAWLFSESGQAPRNEPAEVKGVARVLAELSGHTLDELARITCANVYNLIPRLN